MKFKGHLIRIRYFFKVQKNLREEERIEEGAATFLEKLYFGKVFFSKL